MQKADPGGTTSVRHSEVQGTLWVASERLTFFSEAGVPGRAITLLRKWPRRGTDDLLADTMG
jgi:hypothetical protein